MGKEFTVLPKEKEYLRKLTKEYLEISNLESNKNKEKHWYEHNELKTREPIVIIESQPFADCFIPKLFCESMLAREIEKELLYWINDHKFIDDDKVIPNFYNLYATIEYNEFGLDIGYEFVEASDGSKLGYRQNHPINSIDEDFDIIKAPLFSFDEALTQKKKYAIEDIIGDILPVVIKNKFLNWFIAPSSKIESLLGLENMLIEMATNPKGIHKLYRLVTDRIYTYIDWLKENNMLLLNNGNDYSGSGSYGFTNELPKPNYSEDISTIHMWGNLNSQETLSISPKMFEELVFPYYKELAEKFGLNYFGCCEPVHSIWENCISKIWNLRKVSISPWCDEKYMGEALKDGKVIYCRKPSPNFLGITKEFDEEAFAKHIKQTLISARDCYLEFSFRDIYRLNGNLEKVKKAVKITKEQIHRYL